MIDIIGAAVIVGIIMLAIFGLNVNLSQANYNKLFTLTTQMNTVTLAEIMEFDMVKIGYHVPNAKSVAVLAAKSDSIVFQADLNNTGTINTVKYYLGPTSALSYTKNPNDRVIYRVQDGVVSPMYVGLTSLSITYYNSDGNVTTRPDSVRSMFVQFTIQSPSPVDTSYSTAFWEKRISPKNLWIN
jgi:hypothetical protein